MTESSSGEKADANEKPEFTSKLQIIKNLFVMGFGFILLFTAYNGLSTLQSTMNQRQGIGVASQAIIYGTFFVTTSIFPKYTIRKLGCKKSLVLSMVCYIPYVAANFYFNWITMIPSAIIEGLAASVLWSSSSTYMTALAGHYSNIVIKKLCEAQKDLEYDVLSVKYFDGKNKDGVATQKGEDIVSLDVANCKALQSNETHCSIIYNNESLNSSKSTLNKELGNSVKDTLSDILQQNTDNDSKTCSDAYSSYVPCTNKQELQVDSKDSQFEEIPHVERSKIMSSITARVFGFSGLAYRSTDIWSNLMSYFILQRNSVLDNLTENGNCSCGAAFCPATAVDSKCFEHNLAEPEPEMRYLLTGISVVLTCLAILLIAIFLEELKTDKKPIKFSFDLLVATCRFVVKKEALLLFPLSAYIGFQQGFYMGDFTKSYIACAWGVYHVGLVTVAYGVSSAISSTLSGMLVKYVGRMVVIGGGGSISIGISIYMLLWNPHPSQPAIFFVSAACWGTSTGILWSQVTGFYGVLFKNELEVAFAAFYLWDAVGYTVAYSYSNYICTYVKIYILIAISTIGIIGYVGAEIAYKHDKAISEPKD